MGLTKSSTGRGISSVCPVGNSELTVALAGNPNVGKSTVFNGLTHMHQHTGNWSGKTVSAAWGSYRYRDREYTVVDIPGAYSLLSLSAEEQLARDYICFGRASLTVVVCDATCLQRNLDLVLQILEATPKVILALNLMDEAQRRGISIDTVSLSSALGIPVVCMDARRKRGLEDLRRTISENIDLHPEYSPPVIYSSALESAVDILSPSLDAVLNGQLNTRWIALRLLEGSPSLLDAADAFLGRSLQDDPEISGAFCEASALLRSAGYDQQRFRDEVVSAIYSRASLISEKSVNQGSGAGADRQVKIDQLLTRPSTGIPVMLLLLAVIFFITIQGANYISGLIQSGLDQIGILLSRGLSAIRTPDWLHDPVVYGIWRVLSLVVAVMLPPMAIFFPLFTFLEDLGYLPRVAFVMDERLRRSGSCGKQALTMCMGFGCNAAGVVGCRIIASPRERAIAAITNSFVPCNGRFPHPA